MTLEDISILFGDPVELSFEQALHKAETQTTEFPNKKAYAQQLEARDEAAEVHEVKV